MPTVKWRFSALAVVLVVASLASRPTLTSAATAQRQTQTPTWSTWLLSSPGELRLGPPPDAAETLVELAEIQALADNRDVAALDRIHYWDAGAPPYRWTQRAITYAQSHGVGGNRAIRLMALMNVAIYEAIVAADDSKQAHNRARPATSRAAIAMPVTPGYPDERAAAAGAAAGVLAYLFPADGDLFASWAEEAGRSRVEAGVAYPSDTAAGLALGRQVGERAVAWGKTDGSDAKWTGSVPTEPGKWTGTNPIEPLAGSWKPWTLTSGSQFRPGPPPASDSEQMERDAAEVKNYARTNLTNLTASYWEYFGGRAVFEYWNDLASRLIFEHRLQDDAVQASRVYALVNIAMHDAGIACWDAKYAYWAPRPAMIDPTITTLFATPNHPSYPSAHSCFAGAAATIMTRQFPSEAGSLDALVDQAGEARIMGGIHYRNDVDTGKTLGERVGEVVWTRGS
ncbi:MAG TPA: phosphatase PAP2 family protein [Chloroflexota bacterium]